MSKILIIKTGSTYSTILKQYGDFEDMIIKSSEVSKSEFEIFDAKDESLTFPNPNDYKGIIISGSHDMVTFNDDWMEDLQEWIKTIDGNVTPTLGICFGHQIIATAFGGTVDYRQWGPEVGFVKIKKTDEGKKDPLLEGLTYVFKAYQYHSQSIDVLPKNAILLAKNNIDFYQAIRYDKYIYSVQFHPEYVQGVVKSYIETHALDLTSYGLDPYALLDMVSESEPDATVIKNFIKIVNKVNG